MQELKGKIILVVSPQSWGKMFISKHHYAVELARKGNDVYFLNPPEKKQEGKEKIWIGPEPVQEHLYLIHHSLSFPYNIKFHAIGLFHALMRPHVKHILKKIGKPIDIVWSFDLGNLYPFRFFPDQSMKIFHPVDEPQNDTAIDSAKGAQIIFSVTEEILHKYQQFSVPKHVIHHGIAREFLGAHTDKKIIGRPVRVGLSGNLLRQDIDRGILLQIIRDNPDLVFECWGSYSLSQSNIGGGSEDEATHNFIAALQAQSNVVLHGTVAARELAKAIRNMDLFLVCYDVQKDQSRGTNYHKIMEYLSTGKIIVSNNISSYKDSPELVQMVARRDSNAELPALFKKVVSSLDHFNSDELQQQRIDFAAGNSYEKQVARIEKIIYG